MADVIDVVDENEKNVEISYEEYAAFPTMVYKFKSRVTYDRSFANVKMD